jgi:hypothetical protein
MTIRRFAPSKVGLFLVVVVALVLPALPAASAGSSGSGTFVGTIGKERASVTFKDAYAFRAEDSFDKAKQVTLVILTESPMDKKAMTAALRKERDRRALGKYLDNMAYARLEINQDGEIKFLYFFRPPGFNYNLSGGGKSDVKVNTPKRVEGRFSSGSTNVSGDARKIDLHFATDVADVGAPVRN